MATDSSMLQDAPPNPAPPAHASGGARSRHDASEVAGSTLIARPHSARREVFPQPGSQLYAAASPAPGATSPEQPIGVALLALARQPITRADRLLPLHLDGAGRIRRMLHLHRAAVRAELDGEWRQADFFWERTYAALASLFGKTHVWRELLAGLDREGAAAQRLTPDQLRARLVEELCIDTHCAFFNGHARQSAPLPAGSRAFTHLDHILWLVALLDHTRQRAAGLLAPALWARVRAAADAHRWAEALASCQQLLALLPGRIGVENELAYLHLGRLLARLHIAPDGEVLERPAGRQAQAIPLLMASLAPLGLGQTQQAQGPSYARLADEDVRMLALGIAEVEQLRQRHPYSAAVYEVLGCLHELHALRLRDVDRLREAVVAAQKASICLRGMTPFTVRGEPQGMTELPLVRSLLREIALRPTVQNHLALLDQYPRSGDARRLAEARSLALARTFWEQAGLAPPPDRWNERALVLFMAVTRVIERRPAQPIDVAAFWIDAVAQTPELATLDPWPICRLLEAQLFGAGAVPAASLRFPAPADPPVMPVAPPRARQRNEPFSFWLLSGSDPWLKLRLGVALLLLCFAVGFTARETARRAEAIAAQQSAALVVHEQALRDRSTRDQSYQRLLEAVGRHDDLAAMQQAQAFLAVPAGDDPDPRQAQVADLYSGALVRWYAAQAERSGAQVQQELERYRVLVLSAQQGAP